MISNKELIVGKEQEFSTITEAITFINENKDDNDDTYLNINYITSIKVLEGVYEETFILPENTHIIGETSSNVIIQFPCEIQLYEEINNNYLISCNDNNIIQNITLNLDSNDSINSTNTIKLSPSRLTLRKFGGKLTIDEFRECNEIYSKDYRITLPPMIFA